jgi:hypothetical protein
MTHHQRFALIETSNGAVVIAVDDISHAVPFDTTNEVHPAFKSEPVTGVRVHFKAKGGTYIDLPGITTLGLAEALNGSPF